MGIVYFLNDLDMVKRQSNLNNGYSYRKSLGYVLKVKLNSMTWLVGT